MSTLPPPFLAAEPGAATGGKAIDLDRIAQDLADVEVALQRLDDGTYWTCEITGRTLPDELLAADPVGRRLSPAGTPAAATRPAATPVSGSEPPAAP